MKSLYVVILALIGLQLTHSSSRAELPPRAYPDPKLATDVLDFVVISCRKRLLLRTLLSSVWRYDVTVRAKVLKVQRTSAAIKPGSIITIRYEAHNSSRLGPGSFPVFARKARARGHFIAGNEKPVSCVPWGAPYSAFQAIPDEKAN